MTLLLTPAQLATLRKAHEQLTEAYNAIEALHDELDTVVQDDSNFEDPIQNFISELYTLIGTADNAQASAYDLLQQALGETA